MAIKLSHRARRITIGLAFLAVVAGWLVINPQSYEQEIVPEPVAVQSESTTSTSNEDPATSSTDTQAPLATAILAQLEIKGRAPKTGYARTEFYNNWPTVDGCNLRQRIIKRDFGASAVMDTDDPCRVVAGEYDEPYTGEHVVFTDKATIGKQVQIDHIVALSDAWQKGAQYKDKATRYQIATDPLNLIAADASANMTKSDGDAATWLPSNKKFRCQYVARQVSVKYKYALWVTQAEHDAIASVLETCPNQPAVGVQ